MSNQNGFPCLEGYDAWIDAGRLHRTACELMISVDAKQSKRHVQGYFWLEFSAPNGQLMGWMRFEKQMAIRNQAIFAATEWRPANAQAPALKDVLLSFSEPQPAAEAIR